jgi:hypothetical protein
MKKPPSPGSIKAQQLGCVCPRDDNAQGSGYMGMEGIFVMQANCPLHGTKARNERKLSSEKRCKLMTKNQTLQKAV